MKINSYINVSLLLLALVLVPSISFAADTTNAINCSLTNLSSLVTCAASIMNVSVWFLMSSAFIYTAYGAVRFIGAEGSDREKWRSVMVYGIIGLFVIVSIWGLVSILDNTFNLTNDQLDAPTFKVQ